MEETTLPKYKMPKLSLKQYLIIIFTISFIVAIAFDFWFAFKSWKEKIYQQGLNDGKESIYSEVFTAINTYGEYRLPRKNEEGKMIYYRIGPVIVNQPSQ